MNKRLFTGVVATGIVYCDRSVEVDGDHKKIAILFFDDLTLKIYDDRSDLLEEVKTDAAGIQARQGQVYHTTGRGQSVTLGYGLDSRTRDECRRS
jgi:hypothetical protein